MTRIERLNVKLTLSIRPVVRQEQILHSKPKIRIMIASSCIHIGKKNTHEYVATSSYAVECPTPFKDPAVASDKCARRPLSESPEFRMRRRSTRRFDRKSDELKILNGEDGGMLINRVN
jgi:hypothetical protein